MCLSQPFSLHCADEQHNTLPALLPTALSALLSVSPSPHCQQSHTPHITAMRDLAVTQQEYPDFIHRCSQATIMIMISLACHISCIYAGQQPTKSLISNCKMIFEYKILYCHTRAQLEIQLDLNSYKSLKLDQEVTLCTCWLPTYHTKEHWTIFWSKSK